MDNYISINPFTITSQQGRYVPAGTILTDEDITKKERDWLLEQKLIKAVADSDDKTKTDSANETDEAEIESEPADNPEKQPESVKKATAAKK